MSHSMPIDGLKIDWMVLKAIRTEKQHQWLDWAERSLGENRIISTLLHVLGLETITAEGFKEVVVSEVGGGNGDIVYAMMLVIFSMSYDVRVHLQLDFF